MFLHLSSNTPSKTMNEFRFCCCCCYKNLFLKVFVAVTVSLKVGYETYLKMCYIFGIPSIWLGGSGATGSCSKRRGSRYS